MLSIFTREPDGEGRSPWDVTRSVWYAMFLREAISRTMSDRMGWFWMIAEPVAFVIIMVSIRSQIKGVSWIPGAEFIPWLISGLMGFFLVREGMMRGLGAVDSNQALFAYRQVQPVDPVLTRNFLEGMLRTFVFLLFIVGSLMLDIDMMPDDALLVMFSWFSLWCLGLGAGLVVSVLGSLVEEVGRVVKMLNLPLLILSGVIFPINRLPHHIIEVLMYNPIIHGLETLRYGFFNSYQVVHGTSMVYLWMFGFSLLALGLLLHVTFKNKLKQK